MLNVLLMWFLKHDLLKEYFQVELTRAKESISWRRLPSWMIMCRLKFAMFGSSLSLPPLVVGGELLCESVGQADLLLDHFDSKNSRKSVNLPFTCHHSLSLTTFAFRSSEVGRLLWYLDPYCGIDPLGMYPHFLKRTADYAHILRHTVVFRRLVRLGSFPGLRETGQCHLNSKKSSVLLCCQLLTDFQNISIV